MSATTIPTVYELTVPGRHGIDLPAPDVPQTALPANELRDDCGLPELSPSRRPMAARLSRIGFTPADRPCGTGVRAR